MDCSGVWASGTTYITFEDVKVPVENVIGKENKVFDWLTLVCLIPERASSTLCTTSMGRDGVLLFRPTDALVFALRKPSNMLTRERPLARG
jgi:hypothetical protein